MKECADYVDVGVAVRDHHSLRSCSSATGVINGQQVGFKNGRSVEFFRRCCNQCLVIQPPWLASAERDESGYVWDLRSNTIDPFNVIDAVALFHTESLQRRRPRVASVEKLLIT